MTEVAQTINERIAAKMAAEGWTQPAVAKACDVSIGSVWRWQHGKTTPTPMFTYWPRLMAWLNGDTNGEG